MFVTIYHNAPEGARNATITEKESGQKQQVCLLSVRGTRTEALAALEKFRFIYDVVKVIHVIDIEFNSVKIPTATTAMIDAIVDLQGVVSQLQLSIQFGSKMPAIMEAHMDYVKHVTKVQRMLKEGYKFLKLKLIET